MLLHAKPFALHLATWLVRVAQLPVPPARGGFSRDGVKVSSAVCLVCLLIFACPASAQVIKLEAGASDEVPTQGGSISFHGPGSEGYVGLGQFEGAFRLGAYAKTTFDSFQFTAGDQNLALRLPTDLFGGGQFVTTRGLGVKLPVNANVFVFGGVSTLGVGTPLFQAFQNQVPVGLVFMDKAITDNLHVYSRNIFSQQQTSIQGFDWRARKWLKTAFSAGVGSNKPYVAASVDADRNWYDIKAAYIQASDGFRRITTPSVFASEPDRENILATVKPYHSLVLTAGHENFLSPVGSPTGPFQRAGVDQLQSSFDLAGFRLGAGLFEARGPAGRNVSDGFTASRHITRAVEGSASYYQNISGPGGHTSYLIGTVRETISPKLSLLQVVNRTPGNTNFLFGGSYTANRFAVSVDYQTLYMPFLANPFVTGIGVTLHLKLWGSFQVNGETFRSPDGKLRYTASASTLLTPSLRPIERSPNQSPKLGDYVVRGHVRDEHGAAIEGAAIRIGNQTVFSNEAGEFLLRLKKPDHMALSVITQEFLTPFNFTVVSAPPTVTAAPEDSAPDVLILLRLAPKRPSPGFMPLTKPNVAPTVQPEPLAKLSTEKLPAAMATVPAPQPVSPSKPEAVPATREVKPSAPPVSSPAPPLTEAELFDRNIKDIFFALHRYDIRANQQEALKADAEFLNQHPGMRLLIEGHCDEAGTDAYNMVLGENRAQEVRAALIQEGVEPQRISIVSCGKRKPFCTERNASCHQENRRAHFLFVEGDSNHPERNTKPVNQ